MPFDLQAARAAKKTDTQIADYLGSTLGFDVAAARKAGKTDTQIAEYLSTNDRLTETAKIAPSKSEPNTPKWAGRYPNLYGVAGAAYEVGKPIIEAGGLVLGGMAGTVGATPGVGTLAGAGLGYAGARSLTSAAGQALGAEQPKTIVQQGRQAIGDIATGATMEAGGRILPYALTMKPQAAPPLAADVASRLAVAKKVGTELTPAQATQKPALAYTEEQLRRNILTANKVAKFDAAQEEAVANFAGRIQEKAGGKIGAEEAGQIAQEVGKARKSAWTVLKDMMFDKVPVAKDTLIETNNYRSAATGHLDELGKLENTPMQRILDIARKSVGMEVKYKPQGIVDASGNPFVGGGMPKYTWEQLRSDQSYLRKAAQTTSDFNKKRMFNSLASAIDKDIEAFAETTNNPALTSKLKEAIKYFREGDASLPGVTSFRDKKIANMLQSNSPEKILDLFVKPNNASDMIRLTRVIGEDGTKAIKQAWLEKLFTQGQEQSFNAAKFATSFEKYTKTGDHTLGTFLKKDEIAGLKLLSEHIRDLQFTRNVAENVSKSGVHGINAATLYNYVRHPIASVVTSIGANKMANLYFNNPEFKKQLIYGMRIEPTSMQKAMDAASRLSSIAGISMFGPGISEEIQKEAGNINIVPSAEAADNSTVGTAKSIVGGRKAQIDAAAGASNESFEAEAGRQPMQQAAPASASMSTDKASALLEKWIPEANTRNAQKNTSKPKGVPLKITEKIVVLPNDMGEELVYVDQFGKVYKTDPREGI